MIESNDTWDKIKSDCYSLELMKIFTRCKKLADLEHNNNMYGIPVFNWDTFKEGHTAILCKGKDSAQSFMVDAKLHGIIIDDFMQGLSYYDDECNYFFVDDTGLNSCHKEYCQHWNFDIVYWD